LHGVPTSLPYFIPIPLAFGTFGAVIAMPERIRSRNALLDIGAAGPLAGLAVCIPVLLYGLSLSPVLPMAEANYTREGQSLLYVGLKYLVLGPIPEHYDVLLHPTAVAAWVGLLLTMFNLMPFGQLDGGHIAYALFGDRHALIGRVVRWGLLGLFLAHVAWFMLPVLLGISELPWPLALSNSLTWLLWFGLLSLMKRLQGGYAHPPTDDTVLSPGRRRVAWACLLLFVFLFMPTPMTQY
jgi:membrane-associated protease RseP (regulator of RpoE activity)